MNPIVMRLVRAALATIAPQVVVLIPGLVTLLPPPYNLILTPILMGVGKGLRDGLNPTNSTTHWTKWIPF